MYMRQTANLKKVKEGVIVTLQSKGKMCSSSHALAATYYDILMAGNPSETTTTVAEASMAGYVGYSPHSFSYSCIYSQDMFLKGVRKEMSLCLLCVHGKSSARLESMEST